MLSASIRQTLGCLRVGWSILHEIACISCWSASIGLVSEVHFTGRRAQRGKKPTFWVIPHTHWEGAVFKTREEYLEMGLPNIVKAMRLLREQPTFCFTLDQVAYVRPFLERYPGL